MTGSGGRVANNFSPVWHPEHFSTQVTALDRKDLGFAGSFIQYLGNCRRISETCSRAAKCQRNNSYQAIRASFNARTANVFLTTCSSPPISRTLNTQSVNIFHLHAIIANDKDCLAILDQVLIPTFRLAFFSFEKANAVLPPFVRYEQKSLCPVRINR